jgi:hypothetical protein
MISTRKIFLAHALTVLPVVATIYRVIRVFAAVEGVPAGNSNC